MVFVSSQEIVFWPILDDSLKEKLLKPWMDVLCVHFCVCPSVCSRSTKHNYWHRNLIFWLSDPLDMRKKYIFFLEIFIFTKMANVNSRTCIHYQTLSHYPNKSLIFIWNVCKTFSRKKIFSYKKCEFWRLLKQWYITTSIFHFRTTMV